MPACDSCQVANRRRIFRGHNITNSNSDPNLVWRWEGTEPNPYRVEWQDLMNAIRQNTPYNEVRRGVEASLVTAMGRMACHTGRTVTRDDMLDCAHEFAPDVATLCMDSPAPLQAGSDGKYPVPEPGIKTRREF